MVAIFEINQSVQINNELRKLIRFTEISNRLDIIIPFLGFYRLVCTIELILLAKI